MLDEVIYLAETAGQVPLATQVESDGEGLRVRFEVTDAGLGDPLGGAPTLVSLQELRFAADGEGWSCALTLDR